MHECKDISIEIPSTKVNMNLALSKPNLCAVIYGPHILKNNPGKKTHGKGEMTPRDIFFIFQA